MRKNVIIVIALVVMICIGGYIIFNEMERKRFAEEPYFTSMKLNEREMGYLIYNYYYTCTPDFSEAYDQTKYPDYSYYRISASEWTEKSVFVLNFILFTEKSENDKNAINYANELGFFFFFLITVEWVTKNPKEAVKLMEKLSDQGDYFLQKRKVRELYDKWIDKE